MEVAAGSPVAVISMSGSFAPGIAAPGAAPVGASIATIMPREETPSLGKVSRGVVMSHDQAWVGLSCLLTSWSVTGVSKDNDAEPHTRGGPVAHEEQRLCWFGAITRQPRDRADVVMPTDRRQRTGETGQTTGRFGAATRQPRFPADVSPRGKIPS